MKHLWLRPSTCGKVNRAFGPARSSFIVSGPRLDNKALCQQLRVVLGPLKKITALCRKVNSGAKSGVDVVSVENNCVKKSDNRF